MLVATPEDDTISIFIQVLHERVHCGNVLVCSNAGFSDECIYNLIS